jgi:hypothetical protein
LISLYLCLVGAATHCNSLAVPMLKCHSTSRKDTQPLQGGWGGLASYIRRVCEHSEFWVARCGGLVGA